MELYNALSMPLSSDPRLKAIQEKVIRGESLTVSEKMKVGRDFPVKEIDGYELKPDHAYRAISEQMFEIYKENGMIIGADSDDEYVEYEENGTVFNNNRGVDWYLGGAALKYGDIILECPADKEYFTPACDNGNRLSADPTVKFLKSSGARKPVPLSMITKIIDVRAIKEKRKEEFLRLRGADRQRLTQLREQQLAASIIEEQEKVETGGMSK